MNCTRFDELHELSVTTDLLPADAAPAVPPQAEMDAHLAACAGCGARLQNYVVTTQVLRSLGPVERLDPAPPLNEALVRRILGAMKAASLSHDQGMATG